MEYAASDIIQAALLIGAFLIIAHGLIKDRKAKYHDYTRQRTYDYKG